MDADFWQERWDSGRIGFHQDAVHPVLAREAERMAAWPGTVLVPLAGKSLDVRWLAERGARVVAVERVEAAVEAFFAEQEIEAVRERVGEFSVFRSARADGRIEFWQGDFFSVPASLLAEIDWVYDRAALVALPEASRVRYGAKLDAELPTRAELLTVVFDYDQERMEGPPFSVPRADVERYLPGFGFELLSASDVLRDNPKFAESGLERLVEVTYRGRREPR